MSRRHRYELQKDKQIESSSIEQPSLAEAQEDALAKIDFDTWYIVRRSLIPPHHHKEIIKADFLARKVPHMCTMEEFDSALEKYGLKVD